MIPVRSKVTIKNDPELLRQHGLEVYLEIPDFDKQEYMVVSYWDIGSIQRYKIDDKYNNDWPEELLEVVEYPTCAKCQRKLQTLIKNNGRPDGF